MTDTKPTLEMLIEYQSQFHHCFVEQGIDKWQDGVFDSLKELAAIKSQPVPVEPELFDHGGEHGQCVSAYDYRFLQQQLQVAQQERFIISDELKDANALAVGQRQLKEEQMERNKRLVEYAIHREGCDLRDDIESCSCGLRQLLREVGK